VTALAGAGFRIFPTVRKPADADSLRQQLATEAFRQKCRLERSSTR
jgi:hypothetical protein